MFACRNVWRAWLHSGCIEVVRPVHHARVQIGCFVSEQGGHSENGELAGLDAEC